MKRLPVTVIILIILIGVFFLWWTNGTSPADAKDLAKQTFIIKKGEGVRNIANNLKEGGLIKDPVVFFLLVKQMGIEKNIQAGSYTLSPSQNARDIAKSLTVGTQDVWITIPEGKRAEEIADIVSVNLSSYDESWLAQLVENEGYLFPDTYLFPKEATVDMVISTMRNTFDQRFAQVNNSTNLSKEELVILASMIEREAKHEEDRPLVSSVMHNRLGLDMALQIDATIQYAKGKIGNNWWAPVTAAEYKLVASPYNTYLQPGLPPGPISNPGLSVLKAAANPTDTDYLYYISDKNGVNHYAKTIDQHHANIKKYGL
ncbi:MAG: endolytic transglycosylase MltG [Candidatus Levybacteria bacterium]|nr:endolytic transglycosylase MltG [Candidatus Levybacteria bacterium]